MTLTTIGTRPVLVDGLTNTKKRFTDWQELVNFVNRTGTKITGAEIMPPYFQKQIS